MKYLKLTIEVLTYVLILIASLFVWGLSLDPYAPPRTKLRSFLIRNPDIHVWGLALHDQKRKTLDLAGFLNEL